MNVLLKPVLRIWIPIGVAVSLGCLGLFVITQQSFRVNADDPQLQVAQDAAAALSDGAPATSVVPSDTVDPSVSLAPFVMVYDAQGRPVAGNGRIGQERPTPPKGVLDTAVTVGQNRVTWQPRGDTRIAAVVFPVESGGTVLAGRSLAESEGRVRSLQQIIGMGWLFSLAVTFFSAWFAVKLLRDDA